MKNVVQSRLGFTLIELLVVVLIIGILAAVALPQYQKAVLKSRYSTLKDLVHTIASAEEVYYLANNTYTARFADLDIDMPSGKFTHSTDERYYYPWGYCRLENSQGGGSLVECIRNDIGYSLRFQNSLVLPSVRGCRVYNHNPVSVSVCKQETQTSTPSYDDGGTSSYRYQN